MSERVNEWTNERGSQVTEQMMLPSKLGLSYLWGHTLRDLKVDWNRDAVLSVSTLRQTQNPPFEKGLSLALSSVDRWQPAVSMPQACLSPWAALLCLVPAIDCMAAVLGPGRFCLTRDSSKGQWSLEAPVSSRKLSGLQPRPTASFVQSRLLPSPLTALSVSCGCCEKWWWAGCLKAAEIFPLWRPEVQSQGRCSPSKALRGTPPVSCSVCGSRPSLACGCVTPVSAPVFPSPSSLSLFCLKPSFSLLRTLSLALCVSHSVVSDSLQPRVA